MFTNRIQGNTIFMQLKVVGFLTFYFVGY